MKSVHFAFYVHAYICTCMYHFETKNASWILCFVVHQINQQLRQNENISNFVQPCLMESCPTDSPSPQQGRLPLPWPCDKAESVQGAPVTQETLFHHDFLSIQPQRHPTRQTFHPYCPCLCLTSSFLAITRGKLFWRRGPPSQVYQQQLNFSFQPITAGSISGKHC